MNCLREKKSSSAAKEKPHTKPGLELSFVGDWTSAWKSKSDAEMLDSVGANGEDRRGPNEWSPGTADFIQFAKTGHRKGDPDPVPVDGTNDLLYKIGKYAPRSIIRMYLFTHADKTYLGLSGRVELDSPYFTGKGYQLRKSMKRK
jgi:hypothetical protein